MYDLPLNYSNSFGQYVVTQSQKDVFLRNSGNSFATGIIANQFKNLISLNNDTVANIKKITAVPHTAIMSRYKDDLNPVSRDDKQVIADSLISPLSAVAKITDLENARNNFIIPQDFAGSDEIYQDRIFIVREYIDVPTSRTGIFYLDDNIKTSLRDINKNGYRIYRDTNIKDKHGHFYDFIKTVDCMIPSVPSISRSEVSEMFNRGVRIWDVNNYTNICKNFYADIINFEVE